MKISFAELAKLSPEDHAACVRIMGVLASTYPPCWDDCGSADNGAMFDITPKDLGCDDCDMNPNFGERVKGPTMSAIFAEECANLRVELEATRAERDAALEEITRLGTLVANLRTRAIEACEAAVEQGRIEEKSRWDVRLETLRIAAAKATELVNDLRAKYELMIYPSADSCCAGLNEALDIMEGKKKD